MLSGSDEDYAGAQVLLNDGQPSGYGGNGEGGARKG